MQKAPIRHLADGAAMKRMEKLLLDSKSFFLKYYTLSILNYFSLLLFVTESVAELFQV